MPIQTLEQSSIAFRLQDLVGDLFEVHETKTLPDHSGAVRLEGRFLTDTAQAYEKIAPRLRTMGYTTHFRQEGERQIILAIPGALPVSQPRPLLAAILFLLTLLTVLYTGALMEAESMETLNLLVGWPFAASLLSILLAHEFGHYIVARRLGAAVSLPYFIPFPTIPPYIVSPFGTMGAFINMRTPPTNRRTLLAIAAAGPLAGLALAVPILVIGLSLSEVIRLPSGVFYQQEGNSLLDLAIKYLMFGQVLPSNGFDVSIHLVAYAGWAGLLVTALNLIPAGQLDGGHAIYALLGERAKYVTWAVIAALALLGILWQGWWLWAFLVAFLGQVRATPFDTITSLDRPRQILAASLVVIFILIFTPMPLTFGIAP